MSFPLSAARAPGDTQFVDVNGRKFFVVRKGAEGERMGGRLRTWTSLRVVPCFSVWLDYLSLSLYL